MDEFGMILKEKETVSATILTTEHWIPMHSQVNTGINEQDRDGEYVWPVTELQWIEAESKK